MVFGVFFGCVEDRKSSKLYRSLYAEYLSCKIRRGSVWCGVAQLVARRLAVRQARVRFSARHHREGLPTELIRRWGVGERPRQVATDKWIVWMWSNECICSLKYEKNKSKRVASCHQTFKIREVLWNIHVCQLIASSWGVHICILWRYRWVFCWVFYSQPWFTWRVVSYGQGRTARESVVV